MKEIIPNVFLIGVQKAATTSLYDWIVQHPNVCGPVSMKDTPFFIDDKLFNKGFQFLYDVYKPAYRNEKAIINGSAHNIYFEHALQRIANFNKKGKILVILRNPIERAVSAYLFAKKRNLEKDDFKIALSKENERLQSDNLKILSETTYIDHGFYYRQLMTVLEYFPKENIKVLFYEDVKNKPTEIIKEIYEFIEVDNKFVPDFKKLNTTGVPRFAIIKNLIYNDSKIKKFLIDKVLDKVISHNKKYKTKLFFLNLITKRKENPIFKIDGDTTSKLQDIFKNDIENLENFLKVDLSRWKTNA